jgi:hypothetical protein
VRIVVVLALLASVAHADAPSPIERARQLEARLAYDEALVIVESAIQAGGNDTDHLVELYLMAGRLAAGLDKAKLAEEHFAIVLALRPSTTLPDDTSPKIAVPFTVARTKTKPFEARLVIDATTVAVEGTLPMFTGIAIRYRVGTYEDKLVDRTQIVVARPANSTILEVLALDQYGNTLWSEVPPAPIEAPHVDHPRDDRSIFQRWSTWAVVTGVALTVGGVAAWRFDSAQNEFDKKRDDGMTSVGDLQAIENRGDRWGLIANISFGVAAAAGIATVTTFFVYPKPSADGAVVGVGGRF